jgi:hypothetical protein
VKGGFVARAKMQARAQHRLHGTTRSRGRHPPALHPYPAPHPRTLATSAHAIRRQMAGRLNRPTKHGPDKQTRAQPSTAIATCRQARAHLQRLPDRFSLASSAAPLGVPRHEPPRHCAVVERLRYLRARPGLQLPSQAPCCDGALLALLLRRTARGSGSGEERRKRERAFVRGKVAHACRLTCQSWSQPTCRCSRLGPLSRTQRRR